MAQSKKRVLINGIGRIGKAIKKRDNQKKKSTKKFLLKITLFRVLLFQH